ncbi:hypothetical protein CCM_04813 [Cordyceps militaris CM01]|uniref:Uncharacterized protein n=1 Tax=Cordyceps militaris (strain CM01) TaxID=983644 RepID=G3JEP2_CORMM|nr:uncharacterized protein CCM_04813 [Cordyceps militaris CM01]EGX93439.1 hypothetical protein CCM_04813 [Cordyceps militaris CM01]
MDALVALSLASTLVQFSDYASKLLAPAPQMYKAAHGALTNNVNVQVLIQDLLSLKQRLKRQAPPRYMSKTHDPNTENAKTLEALHLRCMGAIQDLLAHLSRLRPMVKNVRRHDEQQIPDLGRFSQSVPCNLERAANADFGGRYLGNPERRSTPHYGFVPVGIFSFYHDNSLLVISRALAHLARQRSHTAHELRRFTGRILESFYKGEEAFISQIQAQSQKLLQLDEYDNDDDDDDDALGTLAGELLHSIGALQTPEHSKSRNTFRLTNPKLENELRTLIIETCVLESLSFEAMVDRRESVEKAHARTFDWIYKDAESAQVPWSNFVDWLRHGGGIYWINGKVGCGKSTLMRYLCENATTQRELAVWAADRPCEVYSFFFWNSGADDQKSQIGLLRSLLFDILQRHRDLMRRLMPDVWGVWSHRAETALKDKLPYDSSLLPPEPDALSTSALKEIFQKVLKAVGESTKLCFFIDGLDEYGAEHSDIISLAAQCSMLPNVKFCLSSRPLRVFEEAFAGLPSLRLQDLTHLDLSHYVLDCLYRQPRMQQLSSPQSSEVSCLIQETVSKSQGVFLWVKLVVGLLSHGLPTYDSIADLQHQVHQLPADLDDLFAYMVALKDHRRASQLLQIFQAARKRSPEKITLLQLSFATDEDELLAQEAPMQRISVHDMASRCQEMVSQLQSTCAGLLESHDSKYSSIAPDGKVLFLHRTVSDWIAKPSVWAAIQAQTVGTGFSPSLALLKSSILGIKSLDVSPKRLFDLRIVVDAVLYARDAETELGAGFPQLFDQLDVAVSYQWRLGDCRAVYGVDNLSDTSSDTADAQSDKSSYRASMMASQSSVFGTLDLGTHNASRQPAPASLAVAENTLAASYIAHKGTRLSGRATQDQQRREAAPVPKTVTTPHHHWAWCFEVPGLVPMHGAASFYDVARLAGLRHYVAVKDGSVNVLDQDVGQHMLLRAVVLPPAAAVDRADVAALLAGGVDPNFAFNGQTPWEAALAAAASAFAGVRGCSENGLSPARRTVCEDWMAVLDLFLRHGADPYAVARVQDVDDRALVSACTVAESCAPTFLKNEAVVLMKLLVEKRAEFDKKQMARKKKSPGLDIEGMTPASSGEWPMSWIPIRNNFT